MQKEKDEDCGKVGRLTNEKLFRYFLISFKLHCKKKNLQSYSVKKE